MAGKVFGVDLQVLVQQQNVEVPKVVTHILEFLTNREAYLEEGLFRIPGNTVRINELKKIIDKEGKAELNKHKDVDSHTAGGLLKLFLRELPIPIIIPRYYSTFLKVYANADQRQRMVHIRKLILGLPKCNRDLLIVVMRFLNLVAEHEHINKMSSLNLAVIFAPNLIRTQNENLMQIMEDSTKVAGAIQLIIQEIEYVEKGIEPQWFSKDGNGLSGDKSGSLILPSPRLDIAQGSPPSSNSTVSSASTSLNTSMDICSPISTACREDGLESSLSGSFKEMGIAMHTMADMHSFSNGNTTLHETSSEASRNDEESSSSHGSFTALSSTPPPQPPPTPPPTIMIDSPRSLEAETIIPPDEASTSNSSNQQEIVPAAVHPQPNPHFDAASQNLATEHPESNITKQALPHVHHADMKPAHVEHSDTKTAHPHVEHAETTSSKKPKSRLRKATMSLFSPLRKVSQNKAYAHASAHAEESEHNPTTHQNGAKDEDTDEGEDESELQNEHIPEQAGEGTPRAQTPFSETRTAGPLVPRSADTSPIFKPREKAHAAGEREKLTLSDSPDLSSRHVDPVLSLSDSGSLLIRRRSESDTILSPVTEKEEKTHTRNRSNTFLSKIGAMSFRKSTFARNGSEASLSGSFIATHAANEAETHKHSANTDSKLILEKSEHGETHVDKKHEKLEKLEKLERSEKTEKIEKMDLRARVDVRIDDAIDG